jgi:nucleoside-diphosphate-sugar epimerase
MNSDFHEPVNLGNPTEMTILELAECIREITGTSAPIEFHSLPTDDPKIRKPDISRARQILNWEPKVPLDEGLRYTIEDFRQRLDRGEESTA